MSSRCTGWIYIKCDHLLVKNRLKTELQSYTLDKYQANKMKSIRAI